MPTFRTISHPDPNGTCRNTDDLERKAINNWDGMLRAGDSWLEEWADRNPFPPLHDCSLGEASTVLTPDCR